MTRQPAQQWQPRVSVVIPTLNEADNLPYVLEKLPADIHEVLVVDGHSQDDTIEVARRLRADAHIVIQSGRGKGNALACGLAAASGDVIVTMDADGSNDPAEIPRFVQALIEGADFVKGTRYADGGGSADITRLRSLGNHVVRHLVNLCYRTSYSDLCYGYAAVWRRCVPALRLGVSSEGGRRFRGDGFEVETLMSIRAAAAGLAVAEVPSFEHARLHGRSNLRPVRDGWRILVLLVLELRLWRRVDRRQRVGAMTSAWPLPPPRTAVNCKQAVRAAMRGAAGRTRAEPGPHGQQFGATGIPAAAHVGELPQSSSSAAPFVSSPPPAEESSGSL